MERAQTALVLWFGLGILPAAAASDMPVVAAPGPTLTVGVEPGSGPRARFDRDLFAAVAQIMGVGLAWVEVAREDAEAGLAKNRYDVAAGPFASRGAAGPGPLPSVLVDGDAILKRRGDGAIQKQADIAGKAIALIGPAAQTGRGRAAMVALHARLSRRSSLADPIADLAAGRLAALAGPLDVVAAARLARPDLFDTVAPVVGTASRQAPLARPGPLAERISAALGHMRADGSLAALQQRWFGLVFDPPDPAAAKPLSSPPGR